MSLLVVLFIIWTLVGGIGIAVRSFAKGWREERERVDRERGERMQRERMERYRQ
jgi:hypothetical protein